MPKASSNKPPSFVKSLASLVAKIDESSFSTLLSHCHTSSQKADSGYKKTNFICSTSASSGIIQQETESNAKRKTPVIDVDTIEDDIPIIRSRVHSVSASSTCLVTPPVSFSTASKLISHSSSSVMTISSQSNDQTKTQVHISSIAPLQHSFTKEKQSMIVEKVDCELVKRKCAQQVFPGRNPISIERPSFNSYRSPMLNYSSAHHLQSTSFDETFAEPISRIQPNLIPSQKNTLTLEYSKREISPKLRYPEVKPDSMFSSPSTRFAKKPEFLASQQVNSLPSHRILPGSSNYRSPTMIPRSTFQRTGTIKPKFSFEKSTNFLKNQDQEHIFPVKPGPICKSQPSFCNTVTHSYCNLQRYPPQRASVGRMQTDPLSSSILLQQDNCKSISRPLLYNEHSQLTQKRRLGDLRGDLDNASMIQSKIPLKNSSFSSERFPQPTLPKLLNTPNFNMFASTETKNFAAQIQVQKLELENQIHNLKVLEKKIYSSSCYGFTQPGNRENVLQKQTQHIKPFPAVEKRNLNELSLVHEIPNKQPRQMQSFLHGSATVSSGESSSFLSQKSPHGVLDEKCIQCKAKACFVCSGCLSVWYCSKHCQVNIYNIFIYLFIYFLLFQLNVKQIKPNRHLILDIKAKKIIDLKD